MQQPAPVQYLQQAPMQYVQQAPLTEKIISGPQFVQVEAPAAPLPEIPVQLPPAPVSEAIPQAIYSMNTQVAQPILGQTQVLPTQYAQQQQQVMMQGKQQYQPQY